MFPVRTFALLVTVALASGGAAWGLHSLTQAAAGGGSDAGLDTDGDGKYDWLVIEADISLPEAGTWDVYADLSSPNAPAAGACGPAGRGPPVPILQASDAYPPIAWASARYFFPAGVQSVRIAFLGTDIGHAGVDGPYRVHAMLSLGGIVYGVWSGEGPVRDGGFIEWTYTTRAYAVREFETPVRPASFPGGASDVAVDTDTDGLADFLEVRADVQVNVSGHYSLNGHLSKGDADAIAFVSFAYRDLDLALADTGVVLRFRGDLIRAAGIDGPWDFSLTLFGPFDFGFANGTIPPADGRFAPVPATYPEMLCGTTSEYRAQAFDDTVELLRYTGRFEEAAPDWDGDGTADVLTVRAEVDVFVAAGFDLQGVLRVAPAAEVARTASQAWFREGLAWAEFTFPGPEIYASGLDGPYEATLSITPAAWGLDPMTTYTTRAYRASDFDAGWNATGMHSIGDLTAAPSATGLSISLSVVRGDDFLTVVVEDTIVVTVIDASGAVVGLFEDHVNLPSGGSVQSFRHALDGLPAGTYAILAVLGPKGSPVDTRTVTVTL